MEATTDVALSEDRDFGELEKNMEAGFMSSAILERHSSGHGVVMPSWTIIPMLYHAPPDYDVRGISAARSYDDIVENRKHKVQDQYGITWEVDADKLAEHRKAVQSVRKHASDGLSAMKVLKYSEAVSNFDAALKELWTCHRNTLLELWIKVHRGHALLRAGLLQCPAVHGQDTSALLEASQETFQDCQAILQTKLKPVKNSDTHDFNGSLLFSIWLGLAWLAFFRGETTIAETYLRDASDVKLPVKHMRADRDIDSIFLQLALQRVNGTLQETKECLGRFGYRLSDYDEDIFLVGLLDIEYANLDNSVFYIVMSVLTPESKFRAENPSPTVTKFLEQLEAGHVGNTWLKVGAYTQAKVAYETAYASESLLLRAAALVGLGNVRMRDRVVKQKQSATGSGEIDNSLDIQTDQLKLGFAEAEKKYKEALQIYDELGYKEAQIIVHCNLGNLYHKWDQPEQALERYQKALTYFSGSMYRSSAALHLHLKFAELHLDKGNWVEAFKSIKEAANIPTTMNRLGEAWVEHLYGTYYLKKALAMKSKGKQSNWAEPDLESSVATKSRDEQSSGLSEAKSHLCNAVKWFVEVQRSLGRYLTSLSIAIFEQQKETYALLLWCLACHRDNSTSAVEALVWCERSRSRTSMVERWDSFAHNLRESLSDDAVFEALFATAGEKFDNLKWEETWKNLQILLSRCTLSAGTVLVEYVLCADFGYLIFVLDVPGGQPKMKRISFDEQKLNGEKLDRGKLTALVNQTVGIISQLDSKSGKNEKMKTNLASLYKLLIEPVEKWLRKAKHIILIPHEVLFKVPFHALIDGNKKYLIEGYKLSCAESIRNLVQCWFLWERKIHSWQRQDHHNSSIANETRKWLMVGINKHEPFAKDLVSAEQEATEIASMELESGVTVQKFLGSQATKKQLKSHLKDADVIHLATHGIINAKYERGGILFVAPSNLEIEERANGIVSVEPADAATESAEMTTRSVDDFRETVRFWVDSKDRAEELVLSANEISKMDLNARLVVLSACQSADGVILGEGVAGLGRALLTAGVPCAVLSLWPVSDKSTVDFMKEFYTELAQGRPVADAMRTAMVTMLNANRLFSQDRKYTVRDWAAFWSFGLPVVRLQNPQLPREPQRAPSPRTQLMSKLPSQLGAPVRMATAMAVMLAIVFYRQSR